MDITNHMQAFREASRHVWNTYFWQDSAERNLDWSLCDEFNVVYGALFNSIVRRHLPKSASSLRLYGPHAVLEQYHVIGVSNTSQISLMINRDKPASGYWDHPTQYVATSGLDLRLMALFDWEGDLGFRDFRYFMVRIFKTDDPDLIGRNALIDTSYCRVEFVEKE